MCLSCDGYSDEQLDRALDLAIRVHGWSLTLVGDHDDDPTSWGYTIGLSESFGHPDLIAFGASPRRLDRLLRPLARCVAATGSLPACIERHGIAIGAPRDGEVDGPTVAIWASRYGRDPAGDEFLEARFM